MKLFIKIVLSIYYFSLILPLTIQALVINADHSLSTFDPTFGLVINISLYVILIFSGINSLRSRHRKWISKPLLLVLVASYVLWIVSNYIFFRVLEFEENDLVTIFAVPLIPCLIHNIWYYRNFEFVVYDYSLIENKHHLELSDILELKLPFLKHTKTNNSESKFTFSIPFGISQTIITLFMVVWISGWTFGSFMILIKVPFLGVFLLALIIPVLYILIKTSFTKIHLTITNNGFRISETPFRKTLTCKNLEDLEQRVIKSNKGGNDFILVGYNGKKKMTIGRFVNNEIIYVLTKILEAYFDRSKKYSQQEV